jgi:hypothetical protein
MEEMLALGVHHKHYQVLKRRWLAEVDREWSRIESIMSREEQEAILAGGEMRVAKTIEQIKVDIENG